MSDTAENPTAAAAGQGGQLSDSARVEAFSDGVLAIAITLLVLDLRAPVPGDMQGQLLGEWPAYLASFAYIGVIWVNHHQLFTRIAAVDFGLLWRNLALLLGASVRRAAEPR
jgi:TMEM175 potassium channel family protein